MTCFVNRYLTCVAGRSRGCNICLTLRSQNQRSKIPPSLFCHSTRSKETIHHFFSHPVYTKKKRVRLTLQENKFGFWNKNKAVIFSTDILVVLLKWTNNGIKRFPPIRYHFLPGRRGTDTRSVDPRLDMRTRPMFGKERLRGIISQLFHWSLMDWVPFLWLVTCRGVNVWECGGLCGKRWEGVRRCGKGFCFQKCETFKQKYICFSCSIINI